MPLRNGRLTKQQTSFVTHMAKTGDATYSAGKAGYSHPHMRGSQLMNNAAIQEAVRERALHTIRTTLLEHAVTALTGLVTSNSTPAGARVQAIKLVLDTALAAPGDADGAGKPLSAMSRSELQAASTQAMAVLARLDAETIEPEPSGGVFD